MKKCLFIAPLLALTGCGAGEIATTGAGVAGLFLGTRPVVAAPAVALNRELLVSAEKRGKDLGNALTMAARRGIISATQDQDTARPNFCEMVIKEVAVVTDPGGIASALTCRMDHHLDQAGWAFEHGDKAVFETSLGKAHTYMDQLSAIISSADQGVPQ